MIGAPLGAVLGGGFGYVSTKPAAAAQPAPTPVGGTLPPGPYTRLGVTIQGGTTISPSLQPGGTYLLSRNTAGVGNLQQALQQVASEIQSDGMTLLGSSIGIPPAGWPADDPNAAAGIFVAVKNTSPNVATDLGSLTVYAVGNQAKATAPLIVQLTPSTIQQPMAVTISANGGSVEFVPSTTTGGPYTQGIQGGQISASGNLSGQQNGLQSYDVTAIGPGTAQVVVTWTDGFTPRTSVINVTAQ